MNQSWADFLKLKAMDWMITFFILLWIAAGALIFLDLLFSAGRAAESFCGIASYYSGTLEGHPTASTEPYRRTGFTAASYFFYGKTLKVTNRRNGKSVLVRVNDRGPAVWVHRMLDLSEAAFAQIATSEDIVRGTMRVRVEETLGVPEDGLVDVTVRRGR